MAWKLVPGRLFTRNSLKIKKDLELVSRLLFWQNYFFFFFFNITYTGRISSPDCVHISYSVTDVSCFKLRYLMVEK